MNFKDEYKKEFSEISPDEAALERIRKGVANKLAETEKPRKKPLFLRTTMIATGSVAACLVIGVSALLLSGNTVKDKSNFLGITGGAGNMNNNAENAYTSANDKFIGTDSAPNASSEPDYCGEDTDAVITEGSSTEERTDTDNTVNAGDAGNADNTKDSETDTTDYANESITDAPKEDNTMSDPSSAAATIALDGERLILKYNGETTVFEVMFDYFETSEDIKDNAENSKRISVITDDGEKMTAVFLDDDIIALYNSDNVFLRRYIAIS